MQDCASGPSVLACRSRVSKLCGMQAQRGFSLPGASPQDSSQLLFDEAVLETLLGKGSFGCVFRAIWREQEVALKVSKQHYTSGST